MKYIILLLTVFICACTPNAQQKSYVSNSILPEGLKDCNFYEFVNSAGGVNKGYSCPNSTTTTTYTSGKATLYLVFIND